MAPVGWDLSGHADSSICEHIKWSIYGNMAVFDELWFEPLQYAIQLNSHSYHHNHI